MSTPSPGPSGLAPTGPGDGSGGPPAFLLASRGPRNGAVPAAARWHGRQELRADLRASGVLTAVLAACGVPVGLLWWALAPRADFRVTADGPVPLGSPPVELAVAGDSVLVLLLLGLGLLAGAAAWRLRRLRGVAVLVALAVGASLAALIGWSLGELLGPGPTETDLDRMGAVLTTPLRLSALPALATAPFSAVLAYLVGVALTRTDDLGRSGPVPAPQGAGPDGAPGRAGERWSGDEPIDAGLRS